MNRIKNKENMPNSGLSRAGWPQNENKDRQVVKSN